MKFNTRHLFFVLLTFLFFPKASCQKYNLIPSVHSDKWIDGKEWNIDEKQSIRIRTFHQGNKAGKLLLGIEIANHSGEDILIDPERIYYVSKAFDEEKMPNPANTGANARRPNQNQIKVSPGRRLKYIEELKLEKDTVYVEGADKLLKNTKFLTYMGVVLDSDNSLINRGFQKMDEYQKSILLKNTIEPNESLTRVLVIDQFDYITRLELVIPIGAEIFRFAYEVEE